MEEERQLPKEESSWANAFCIPDSGESTTSDALLTRFMTTVFLRDDPQYTHFVIADLIIAAAGAGNMQMVQKLSQLELNLRQREKEKRMAAQTEGHNVTHIHNAPVGQVVDHADKINTEISNGERKEKPGQYHQQL